MTKIFLCRHSAEVFCEVEHLKPIHTQLTDHSLLFRQSGEKSERTRFLLQNIAGMWPECYDHAFIPTFCCSPDELLYYKTVSDVDTVEKSGCYNHLTSSKSCL